MTLQSPSSFVPLVSLALAISCSGRSANAPTGPSCEERKTQLLKVLGELPQEGHGMPLDVDLPVSAFGGAYTKAPTLEITERGVRLRGRPLLGESRAERKKALQKALESDPIHGVLLVAAAAQVNARTLHDYFEAFPKDVQPRLLFRAPALSNKKNADQLNDGLDLADQVLVERDPLKRRELARQGYGQFAPCPATTAVADAVEQLEPGERWPALARSMPSAISQCPCEQLEPDPLRRLLVAEQRAGTAAVGSVSVAFLSDIRCRASMPLRSIQQILLDIDEFDAEFSGNWREDALVFDQVVTDERLLVYLCNAMAGDVLSELQRDGRSLYLKIPSSGRCDEWRFKPIARGAPMGFVERRRPGADLRFHFRQAGNELRLFGPAPTESAATTEAQDWTCDEDLHLAGAEEDRIQVTGNGAWFFTAETCQNAPASTAFKSCLHSSSAPEASSSQELLHEPAPFAQPPAR